MERRQTNPYCLVNLRTGEGWDFGAAIELATHLFLFGSLRLSDFAIFKDGARWPRRQGGEAEEYAAALDRWSPKDKVSEK